jgi:16S rRNA (uracil1498-N3)-methyltransferase
VRRVFIPRSSLDADLVRLVGSEAHYLRSVLRLGLGGRFSAVLPTGVERLATVQRVDDEGVEAILGDEQGRSADPLVDVRIRPALTKARKLDAVVRQCTELGASEIGPVLCERSVARPDEGGAVHKLERWRAISLEAARQCGRTTPPRIAAPVPFRRALEELPTLGGTALLPAPAARSGMSPEAPLLAPDDREPISVLVGPEGGFTVDEVKAARAAGCRVVGLGRRILRAETAAVAVCAWVMYELRELL